MSGVFDVVVEKHVPDFGIKIEEATERGLDAAAAVLLDNIRKRFLKQQAPDGTTWPVSKAALRRKATGRDGGTLFDTGTLFHSIQLANGGPMVRTISTDVPYGPQHQWGLNGLPQRMFLGFSPDDVSVAAKIIALSIKRNLT